MKKITNYLNEHGFKIIKLGTEKYRHEGGKSFENDGTYLIDIFSVVGEDESFHIFSKSTGRNMYAVGDTPTFGYVRDMFFTQKELIEHIEMRFKQ